MLNKLDADRIVKIVPDQQPGFAPGACGNILWGDAAIGHIGLLEKKLADRLSLREVPAMAELLLAPLIAGMQHVPQLHPLPRFPAVKRDLSLIVRSETPYQAIESLIHQQKLADLEAVEYVVTYRGKPLDKQDKSVTVTLVFRSREGTLTSEQVEPQVQKVIAAAQKELGATLRS